MKEVTIDVAVIGAGTAGLNALSSIQKAGCSWVLIESGQYGTTCARNGCMPSKLLIAASDAANEIISAHRFGISVEKFHIDDEKVMKRVRAERDRFVSFVVEDTEALPAEFRLKGHARFIGPNTLEVGGHTRVTAGAIVIASGSSPLLPKPFDNVSEHILTNEDVFELKRLPKNLAVIGTGIIGLELGQAFSRLGVNVTFLSRSKSLGPSTDPIVNAVISDTFAREHDIRLEVNVIDVKHRHDGVRIHWIDSDKVEHKKTFEKILVTVGRRPNLEGLNLDATGLELDSNGKPEWNPETGQCGSHPIFLAGDVSSYIPLLHEASDEGRMAGWNAAKYPEIVSQARRTPLAIVFTDPQIAMTGMHYGELDLDMTEIGEVSFEDQGRARVIGENQGILRVYALRNGCNLIGAEMFGPQMEHMAHLLAWAIQQKLTVQEALEMPVYHPVLEEGLRTALRSLAAKLKITGETRCEGIAKEPGC